MVFHVLLNEVLKFDMAIEKMAKRGLESSLSILG